MPSPETPYLDQFANEHTEIPSQIHALHLKGLNRVYRWIGGLTPSRAEESDLSHVESIFKIDQEIKDNFPMLGAEINLERVKFMHYVHDDGELIVGDLVRSIPNYDQVRQGHKQREEEGYYLLVDRYIKDPALKQEAISAYQEYLGKETPESLLANLLDKIQGIRFALQNVFDMNKAQNPEERAKYLRQARASVELIFQFATPLRAMLSPKASGELVTFLQLEFGRYRTAGYFEIFQAARSRLFGGH